MRIVGLLLVVLCVLIGGERAEADVVIDTIAYEASGEPIKGQVLVAECIINRARERSLTLEKVCLQKSQFSCWMDGKPTQRRRLTSKELTTAANALRMAYESKTGTNLYMRSDCKPKWLREALRDERVMELMTVGAHTFYREVR